MQYKCIPFELLYHIHILHINCSMTVDKRLGWVNRVEPLSVREDEIRNDDDADSISLSQMDQAVMEVFNIDELSGLQRFCEGSWTNYFI